MFEDLPTDPSLEDPLPTSPLPLLGRWFDEARAEGRFRNPHAMALATVDAGGRPHNRVVLCRGWQPDPGYVVFYTNRESQKGEELAGQPYAAATFYWDGMQRQARLEGRIVHSPDAESDGYFSSRPRPSQIAAWASDQSQPIASRMALIERLHAEEARFADESAVPRPPNWGGYRLLIERLELWVGAEGRAHDRGLWERDDPEADSWRSTRLQP